MENIKKREQKESEKCENSKPELSECLHISLCIVDILCDDLSKNKWGKNSQARKKRKEIIERPTSLQCCSLAAH